MRVLFVGDAAQTGFGSVTMDLGRALLALGLDVRFISQNDTGSNLAEPFRSRTVDFLSLVQGRGAQDGKVGGRRPERRDPGLIYGTSTAPTCSTARRGAPGSQTRRSCWATTARRR